MLSRTQVVNTSQAGNRLSVGAGAPRPFPDVASNVNVEMGTVVVDGSRINVPSYWGSVEGGFGFGGTSDNAGPSDGQNEIYALAVRDGEEIVHLGSVLYMNEFGHFT